MCFSRVPEACLPTLSNLVVRPGQQIETSRREGKQKHRNTETRKHKTNCQFVLTLSTWCFPSSIFFDRVHLCASSTSWAVLSSPCFFCLMQWSPRCAVFRLFLSVFHCEYSPCRPCLPKAPSRPPSRPPSYPPFFISRPRIDTDRSAYHHSRLFQ